ncbi:TetR/AcrR family transcriptional regulator [Pseudomaricurvus sp.]|uniref:TetR/AcrR family transcriptional regulator n=1 Tax=Pseudomaricurvus sp. TaxID=2004510 RepID=UPI003F6CBAE2
MTPNRRLGNKTAKNRAHLITAAETLMCREGYASVTARKVATEAGLKVQLIYYYFQTMDDLVLEVVRQHSAQRMKYFIKALASAEPLRALWDMNRNKSSALFTTEVMAMANHKESIRKELATIGDEFRTLQAEAVGQILEERGLDTTLYPPTAIVATISALSRATAQDSALGANSGYAEAAEIVERLIDRFSTPAKADRQSDSHLTPLDNC